MIRKPARFLSARSMSLLLASLGAFATFALAAGPAGAGDVPPTPTFTQAPPSISRLTTATFVYDLQGRTQAQTFCRLDLASFDVCDPSTMTFSGLAGGRHSFEVYSFSQAGGDSPHAIHSWTIDLTPPDTSVTIRVDANGNVRLTSVSNERGSTFQCKLVRVGRWVRCESVVTLAIADLPIEVRAVDRAGNVDPTPASVTQAPRR